VVEQVTIPELNSERYNITCAFYRKIIGDQSEGTAEGPASKRLRITHRTSYQLMRQQAPHPTGDVGNDEVCGFEMSTNGLTTHQNSERLPHLCLSKVDPADWIADHAESECKSSTTYTSPDLTASMRRMMAMEKGQVGWLVNLRLASRSVVRTMRTAKVLCNLS